MPCWTRVQQSPQTVSSEHLGIIAEPDCISPAVSGGFLVSHSAERAPKWDPSTSGPPPLWRQPHLVPPNYGSQPGKCQGFLTQCTLAFKLQLPDRMFKSGLHHILVVWQSSRLGNSGVGVSNPCPAVHQWDFFGHQFLPQILWKQVNSSVSGGLLMGKIVSPTNLCTIFHTINLGISPVFD